MLSRGLPDEEWRKDTVCSSNISTDILLQEKKVVCKFHFELIRLILRR